MELMHSGSPFEAPLGLAPTAQPGCPQWGRWGKDAGSQEFQDEGRLRSEARSPHVSHCTSCFTQSCFQDDPITVAFWVKFQKVPHLEKGSLGSMRCRDPGHVMFAQLWQSPPKESSDPMFIQDPCQS